MTQEIVRTHAPNQTDLPSRKDTIRVFDRIADKHSKSREIYRNRSILRKMVEFSNVKSGMIVADLGMGEGVVSRYFSDVVGNKGLVVGLDISGCMTKAARRQSNGTHKNLDFILSDLSSIPLRKRCLPVVVCRFLLHHIHDSRSFFWNLYHLLKPNGHALICDGVTPRIAAVDSFFNTVARIRDPSHVRYYTKHEILEMFKDVGFRDIRCSDNLYKEKMISLKRWVGCINPSIYSDLRRRFAKVNKNVKKALEIRITNTDVFFRVPLVIVAGQS